MKNYVHDIPGRLRIKIPKLKGSKSEEIKIKKLLVSNFNDLGVVEVNTTTGSILIYYNHKKLNSRDILNILINHGYVNPNNIITNDEYVKGIAEKVGNVAFKLALELYTAS